MAEMQSEYNRMTNEELYKKVFPYYLSIGCTYEQFWNMESWIAAAYREAEIYRKEQRNFEMWLQGAYVNNAIQSGFATFSYGFGGKKGKKPEGYIEHPFAMTEREKKAEKQRAIERSIKFFADGQK